MWHRLILDNSPRSDDGRHHRPKCKCSECQEIVHYAGFRRSLPKVILFYVISIVTFGLPLFMCWMKKDLFVRLTSIIVEPDQLGDQDTVLVVERYRNRLTVVNVEVVAVNQCVDFFLDSDQSASWRSSPVSMDKTSESEDRRLVSPASSGGQRASKPSCNSPTTYSSTDMQNESTYLVPFFEYENCRFFYKRRNGSFRLLTGLEDKMTPVQLRQSCRETLPMPGSLRGLTPSVYASILLPVFGSNELKTYRPSCLQMLLRETLNPFYVFQLGAIILWSLDEYFYYAMCILLISIFSITISLRESIRQLDNLEKMIHAHDHEPAEVLDTTSSRPVSTSTSDEVCSSATDRTEEPTSAHWCPRQLKYTSLDSTSLVPGHVIRIPSQGCVLMCDAVLIYGSCIVNEAMLTGESMAVVKTAIPDRHDQESVSQPYSPSKDGQHTLFAGTTILQTRFYDGMDVLAVVVRTGFSTTKGSLVRSIMHPRPVDFHFYRDAFRFVVFLFVIACFGMAYSFHLYYVRGVDWESLILRCLDIVTIVVPPALPAVMTVGTYYSQSRLRKASIYCLCPSRINICGQIDVMCLDKTGTITEDCLDLEGIVLTETLTDSTDVTFSRRMCQSLDDVTDDASFASIGQDVVHCLASCHSLSMVNGALVGDPLEQIMFEFSGWRLRDCSRSVGENLSVSQSGDDLVNVIVEPQCSLASSTCRPIGIIKWFDFDSDLARMSVVTRRLGDTHFVVYTKGAPERVCQLCTKESIPVDFVQRLNKLTGSGFRVLALACRSMPAETSLLRMSRAKRSDIESQLRFLGLLVLKNNLKRVSRDVISELRSAGIRCVMLTGDNLLTALSVGRDVNMVEDSCQILQMCWTPRDNENNNNNMQLSLVSLDSNVDSPPDSNGTDDSVVDRDVEACQSWQSSRKISTIAITGSDFGNLISAIDSENCSPSKTEWYIQMLHLLLDRGTIFARMSPEQKAQLIRFLQDRPYNGRSHSNSPMHSGAMGGEGGDGSGRTSNVVGMCGDGANDCGALKVAHVGVSLADSEASVAAPFTSRVADISCLVKLALEGRCALVTSFTTFKYMALYSFIQFISVMLLYTVYTNFADLQFLYIDLFVLSSLAVSMGSTRPAGRLSRERPLSSLLACETLASIGVQISVVGIAQAAAYMYLIRQSWFVPVSLSDPDEEITVCWENTAIFFVSTFQYISMALVFSEGKPCRQPFYTNLRLVIAMVVLTVSTLVICLAPGTTVASEWLELMPDLHMDFRFALLTICISHLALAWMSDWLIVRWKICDKIRSLFSTPIKEEQLQHLTDIAYANSRVPVQSSRL